MFTFKQFCEHATSEGRYGWFYIVKPLMATLAKEELDMIYVEVIEGQYNKCWYPREKFFNQPLNKDGLQKLLKEAIEKEQWDQVKQLNERIKNIV